MAKQTVADIFNKLRDRLVPVLNQLPTTVGNVGVNYSLDAFDKQAWDGNKWAKRKSKKDAGRAVLVKSGALRRSIRVVRTTPSSVVWGSDLPYASVHNNGGEIKRQARQDSFIRPRYQKGAKGKMFGGMGAFRKMSASEKNAAPVAGQKYKAYSFNMPQRRFIGDSPLLRKKIAEVVKSEMQKAIKGL